MVIGNGFFSENREAALAEMTERSKCEVKHLPYPTVGNITYYISYVGDLYGQQMIQGRPLTRQRKHQRHETVGRVRVQQRQRSRGVSFNEHGLHGLYGLWTRHF